MMTADRGGAQDEVRRIRAVGELEERSNLGYSSSCKRLAQLMPATRDELFTRLSNQ